MWIALAPIWMTRPPAMIAAGISSSPFAAMAPRTRPQEESAAA